MSFCWTRTQSRSYSPREETPSRRKIGSTWLLFLTTRKVRKGKKWFNGGLSTGMSTISSDASTVNNLYRYLDEQVATRKRLCVNLSPSRCVVSQIGEWRGDDEWAPKFKPQPQWTKRSTIVNDHDDRRPTTIEEWLRQSKTKRAYNTVMYQYNITFKSWHRAWC